MAATQLTSNYRQVLTSPDLRINYIQAQPPPNTGTKRGTILLIHGFPQSSYQFRHVIAPLAAQGYHVIVPDYRGHGYSSHPADAEGYTKVSLAQDLFSLLKTHLHIEEKVHVVGHDIGGMIAHAFAHQFPEHVASITWGECPLPGSAMYERDKHSSTHWHFDFQSHDVAIACALVAGKERMYIKHFFDRLTRNHAALTSADVDFYAAQYSMPDAMRCAFLTYRAFEEDARVNRDVVAKMGKSPIPCMVLSGADSWAARDSGDMAREFYANVKEEFVADSGHYLAEENPQDFVEKVLRFLRGFDKRSTE